MNIQHSSRTDLWYTPLHIIDMVKRVLGTIDLDPASDPDANRRVGATQFFTAQEDGLLVDWSTDGGSVFLNPPGGKRGNQSLSVLFWEKLMLERSKGNFAHAIYMGFSLEQLQTTQRSKLSIGDFPFCVPKKRLAFDRPDGTKGKAPSHSNVIAYVPGTVDRTDLFKEVFDKLGCVVVSKGYDDKEV